MKLLPRGNSSEAYVIVLHPSNSSVSFPLIPSLFCFRISNDIEYMTGKRPHMFWMLCWKYISPGILIIVFTGYIVTMISSVPTYRGYVGCEQVPLSIFYIIFIFDVCFKFGVVYIFVVFHYNCGPNYI